MDNDRRTRAVNSGQKTPLWIVAVSVAAAVLTTMLLLMGFAWFHVPPTLANVALLGTVLAGVGTAGGLVVGLLSLYVLSDVNGRIEQKLDSSRRQSKDELQQRFRQAEDHEREMMQRLTRALTKMSMASFHPTDVAEELIREAIELFPELPYAREGMGHRFAKQTFSHAWKNVAGGMAEPQSADFAANRGMQGIRWLREATVADRDKKVSVEDLDSVWWDLAKLYSLAGDHTEATNALACVTDIQTLGVDVVDIAMLLHDVQSPEVAREVCRGVGWPIVESLSFSERGNRWLALRQVRGEEGRPPCELVTVTVKQESQNKSTKYTTFINDKRVATDNEEDAARRRVGSVTPLVIADLTTAYQEFLLAWKDVRRNRHEPAEPAGLYEV